MNIIRRIRSLFPSSETIEGYEHPELVEVVFQKTKAYTPDSRWSETAKTVLDFGGGCGLHYKEAGLDARWAVVETAAMVARASELATDKLKFFTSIQAAAEWLETVDLVHSNGALQYTPDPCKTLNELVAIGADVMIWRRLAFSENAKTETQTSNLIDNGPGRIISARNKLVRYSVNKIPESEFIEAHGPYKLTDRSANNFRFVRSLAESC